MSHDASKIVLASSRSNVKDVETFNVDPASFQAGLVVSLASTGLPSLLRSAGMRLGVSLGKSLSDSKKTDVLRAGLKVPVQAHNKRASGIVTITNFANLVSGTDDALAVAGVSFVAQAGAATPGAATFQAATSNDATATSLAAQINAHATANLVVFAVANAAVVSIYSVVDGIGGTGTGNDIAVAYTDNDANVGLTLSGLSGGKLSGGSAAASDIDYIVIGSKMHVNNTTGKADVASSLSTLTDAVYVSNELTGILEDNSELGACLVDMAGGL